MPKKQGYKKPMKVGARNSAKFQKPGASREETGMAQRSGTASQGFRTVIREKVKPSRTWDDRLASATITRKK